MTNAASGIASSLLTAERDAGSSNGARSIAQYRRLHFLFFFHSRPKRSLAAGSLAANPFVAYRDTQCFMSRRYAFLAKPASASTVDLSLWLWAMRFGTPA